jgi:hypothetical protein
MEREVAISLNLRLRRNVEMTDSARQARSIEGALLNINRAIIVTI